MIVTYFLTAWVLLLCCILLRERRKNYPPGPFPWPFIGNLPYLRKLTKKLGGQHLAFKELCRYYNSGVIALKLGNNRIIVVSAPKLIFEVLHSEQYDGRPWNEFTKVRNLNMKKGITMNDGEEWKEVRAWSIRALREVGFARKEMYEFLLEELQLIINKLKNGGIQCMQTVISSSVLNVLWRIITTKPIDSAKFSYFMDLMENRRLAFDVTGGMLVCFPWLRYVAPNISGYNALIAFNNELESFLIEIINEHKQQYTPNTEIDFIDLFLRKMFEQETKNSVFTDENLLLTLLDFFVAGNNNTTTTLHFLFLHMMIYPDVQEKLHREIDAVIGRDRLPSLEDRLNMPFAEAVLIECQRLWLVTPVVGPRRVLSNTTLGGYTIPKGSTVVMNLYSVNVNSEMYDDPTLFKPERHLSNGVYQNPKIVLFGAGRRRCPGEALAKSAIFLLFIGVMQKYRLLPVPGEEPKIDVTDGITLSLKKYNTLIVPR